MGLLNLILPNSSSNWNLLGNAKYSIRLICFL